MDFAYSPKVQELRERVTAFMDAYVYPAEPVFERPGQRRRPLAAHRDHGGAQSQGESRRTCGTCSCPNPNWALA